MPVEVRAELPGVVLAAAAVGTRVGRGEEVALLESMKMEIPLLAPAAGEVVASVPVGTVVQPGAVVVALEPW